MAEIIYKPHCSECGALITDEVNYISYEGSSANYLYTYGISPYKCSKCGKYFSIISIKCPTKVSADEVR